MIVSHDSKTGHNANSPADAHVKTLSISACSARSCILHCYGILGRCVERAPFPRVYGAVLQLETCTRRPDLGHPVLSLCSRTGAVILAGLAGPRHNSIGPPPETCPNVTWPVQDDEAKKLTSTPSNFGADADTFSCQALTKLCIQGCPTPQLSSTLHRNLPLTRWAPSVRHAVVTWLSLSGY